MKNSYRRSLLWRLAFFGLPIVAFGFMFAEVSHWEKPRWGPRAIDEAALSAGYLTVSVMLAAFAAIPYLALLLRFCDRYQLTDEFIRRKALFRNRTLAWKDIIEYRDFLNYIQLVPISESGGLYIDYYVTLNKHRQFTRLIGRKCREVEANLMVRRRRGRLVLSDLGVPATSIFVVGAGLLLYLIRQRIIFLGVLSGMVLALVSAWVWIVTRRHPERWRSGGYIYETLFLLFLILPPAYFGQAIMSRGFKALGTFAAFYLIGLLAGSGVAAAQLPSRKRR